jgi:hypothetical protein
LWVNAVALLLSKSQAHLSSLPMYLPYKSCPCRLFLSTVPCLLPLLLHAALTFLQGLGVRARIRVRNRVRVRASVRVRVRVIVRVRVRVTVSVRVTVRV